MAVSKFSKVNSLFKTTLTSGLAVSDTSMTLQSVPTGNIQYPNWVVIEPDSANAELIYLPTAPTGTTYTGIVRGVSLSLDTDAATTGIAHAANVDVVMSMTHRQWNDVVAVMQGTSGTGYNTYRIGDELDSDKTIYAHNADATKPYVQYNAALNKWLISNDGVTTYDIAAGGSGVSSGLGVSVTASLVDLNPRTSGGLRNNQGTGSRQADVDPAIVARLDTANTFTAVQTLTAARLQVTTDATASNDAVRYSLLQSFVPGGTIYGTSGEAITAGQGVYVKASDGKLYKTVGTSNESTFSFVGIASTTVGAADLSVGYAPPGHIVQGLAGLTAGSYYFVSDTAGTLATTPGTRFARVGLAVSTTIMMVVAPKYRNSGSQTFTSVTSAAQTVGFYPGKITLAVQNHRGFYTGGSISSTGAGINQHWTGSGSAISAGFAATSGEQWDCKDQNSGTTNSAGSVSAKSATGFTLNETTHVASDTTTIYWLAESL